MLCVSSPRLHPTQIPAQQITVIVIKLQKQQP